MTVRRQRLEKSLQHDWDQKIRTKFSSLRSQEAKSDARELWPPKVNNADNIGGRAGFGLQKSPRHRR
jgi:hypothetical protein